MSEVDNKVKMIVEGLLLAAGRPLTLDNITAVFSDDEKPDRKELKAVMDAISADCDDRGFELKEVASGFRFQVKQDLSEWVAKLWEEKPPRYTRALLETLALIAYRQPITRGDIEEIRGVAVSPNIIRTLLDREWVRVVGHRDVPGRPAMFATTKQFLDYFDLKSLQELPPLSEIKELDKSSQEVDLADDLANQRVIDLPEDSVDENAMELSDEEKAEMLAEEEAIELAKKPLDEILAQDPLRQQQDDEDFDDEDDDSGASEDAAGENAAGEAGAEAEAENESESGVAAETAEDTALDFSARSSEDDEDDIEDTDVDLEMDDGEDLDATEQFIDSFVIEGSNPESDNSESETETGEADQDQQSQSGHDTNQDADSDEQVDDTEKPEAG